MKKKKTEIKNKKRSKVSKLVFVVILLLLTSCTKNDTEQITDETTQEQNYNLLLETIDEGDVVFYSYQDYYRYGPSIIEYDDGSMDAWFSAPGNNTSQWDWITYRHSDNGIDWGPEEVVLTPTPGSKDQCSVCDPGLIFFNGYYYLGYTSTAYREGKGSDNSAFVARSLYPDGPFEKWNGSGWGGDPEPIIAYEGEPEGWGIGELSFVIYDEELYIYYTLYDLTGGYIGLYKADLSDNWPETMRYKDIVLIRDHQDSLDVVYDDNLGIFLGFSIYQRMAENSRLIMYASKNGKEFEKADSNKDYIEDYAHNMGIAKSLQGHVNTEKEMLIGYAYGENWGRWNTRFQHIRVTSRN